MYFRCDSCNAVYWAYYPIDDCCIKCNVGLIRFIEDISHARPSKVWLFYFGGGRAMTMTMITPTLKLHTRQDTDSTSIQINSLILAYNGNHYHLEGGTGDTIHVFIQSIAIYVLTTNKANGRMALNAYMVPQPDPINGVYMHTPQDIENILGTNWEQLSALDLTLKLINYLM